MTPHKFVQLVANTSLPNTFNPYSDRCETYDCLTAPKERRASLLALIENARKNGVDSLWIGRDLGHRGGRRTGMALTDDVRAESYARRWAIPARTVTVGPLIAERTAEIIWRALDRIPEKVLLWNVFPFHPYLPGAPFTNRAHSAFERRIGEEILDALVQITRPHTLVAVGNDAAASLRRYETATTVVQFRHPSFGGQNTFLRQVKEFYNLPDDFLPQDAILT
jgi:hypothetical protein